MRQAPDMRKAPKQKHYRTGAFALTAVAFLGSSLLIQACSKADGLTEQTPDIPNWGNTPTTQGCFLPYGLNCSCFTHDEVGLTWNGLTVGASTSNDVLNSFPTQSGSWDTLHGSLVFSGPLSSDYLGWSTIESCFVGDRLSALNVLGRVDWLGDGSVDGRLDSWLRRYGNPDYITWSYDYYSRTLVWPEEGIIAVIGFDPFGGFLRTNTRTLNFILFSPIPHKDFENSWIIGALPAQGPRYSGGENPPLPPEMDVEDPWYIEP